MRIAPPPPSLNFLSQGWFALAVLLLFAARIQADEATLTCAKDLATKYAGYTYGTGSNQTDCVHFVLDVVECRLHETLSAEVRRAVLIAHGWSETETQTKAEAGTEPKLGGVQYALTELLSKGKNVKPEEAKPGDLVQYWMPSTNGAWFGHCAVISKVTKNRATLLGAHQSTNKVTELRTPLNLLGAKRHVFVVRIGD